MTQEKEKQIRISVAISAETHEFLDKEKKRGISVSFIANQLLEAAIKERIRLRSRKGMERNRGQAPLLQE